jgi:outer membrane biosynthesis protein TonB
MADNEHIAEVGRLLAQRYNVPAVDGDLADALAAGDVKALEVLIGEREMYRWAGPIAKALAAARGDVQPEPEAEPEAPQPEPEESEAVIEEPVPEPTQDSPSVEAEEPAPEPKKAARGKK